MILYNMTDMFFVGQLGDYNQVAAVSVVSPLFSLSAAVATMLGSGGCALIARVLGSDDIKQFLYILVGIRFHGQGFGCVSDQAVDTYLISSCTVQQGRKCAAAVVWRMVGNYPDGSKGFLE